MNMQIYDAAQIFGFLHIGLMRQSGKFQLCVKRHVGFDLFRALAEYAHRYLISHAEKSRSLIGFLCSCSASSGQISCQSCGRNSCLVTMPFVRSSSFRHNAGPKNNRSSEDRIFLIYPIDVPQSLANSCRSDSESEFMWCFSLFILYKLPVGNAHVNTNWLFTKW